MSAVATTTTGGRAVAHALAAHGVEVVWGIPGTHNLEIYAGCRPPASATSARATSRARGSPPTATAASPAAPACA